MSQEQHLPDVAQFCRREAKNSTTGEAKQALAAMANDFEQRADAARLRGKEERLVFVSVSGRKHLF
jgi:hypothetical protein